MSLLTPCRLLYLHGILFSNEKGRDTVKRTYEKDLQGQYLLDSMEALTMSGDAYVSSDQLYRFAKRSHKALTYDRFRSDRAFLLREGHLHLEGTRLYIKDVFLRTGDRVIALQNDWEQGICNGDIGTYYHKSADGMLLYGVSCNRGRTAAWGREGMDPLSRLRLAYIITIHKSQGSEWDTIVLPVSKGFSHMLHRNLLYTAISRARKRVVIVGDPDALNTALRRKAPYRRSMLVPKTHAAQEHAA